MRPEELVDIARIMYLVYLTSQAYNMIKSRKRRLACPVNFTQDLDFVDNFINQLRKNIDSFFKVTRMSIGKFDILLSIMEKRWKMVSVENPIQPKIRLTLTLLYLSQGYCPKFLELSHKIGLPKAQQIIYETCQDLWEELHEIYLALPSSTKWTKIAEKFSLETGMPHCLGAIEAKLVDILRSKSSRSPHNTNRKSHNTILLAACDSNYTFTFVDIGKLESKSNEGVFSKTAIVRKVIQGTLNVPEDQDLPGENTKFPFYFVGDIAFPLRKNLMRPFPGYNLAQDKQTFNDKIFEARIFIENTFGILVKRWKVLNNGLNTSPENIDKIVLATVVLHNFLMINDDSAYFSPDLVDRQENGVLNLGRWRENRTELQSIKIRSANRGSNTAFKLRNILKTYLSNN